jgi:UDPglucose 6-dehydrogenase
MNIGVIGVGRLGLAYALLFEKNGYNVFASSYKEDYIETLNTKQIDSVEPGINELLAKSTNIHFTTDNHEIINNCDVIYVMVATPSTGNGDYDVSAVFNVVNDFKNHNGSVEGKILIIGSTTNPGTCDEIEPLLTPQGIHIVYMPTFVAQGSVIKNIENVPAIIIGTENLTVADKCKDIFSSICVTPPTPFVIKSKTGEILKLASNCKQTMQISFINMIGQMLLDQGLDNDLVQAGDFLSRAKSGINYKFGFGFGGPCFPRDNRSLVHFAKSIGMDYPMGELVDQFNQDHVIWITNYLIEKNTKNLPFYFEYVSYKKGVAQFEESHQLQVCKNLLANGQTVYIENSEFLLSKIQQDLSKEFTNLVKFVTINDINNDVYKINL